MTKLYGSLEAGGTKFICAVGDENFNVVIIAKIVYMEEFARKLYRDLAHQSDKDMNMEKDLQSVYRKIRMDN